MLLLSLHGRVDPGTVNKPALAHYPVMCSLLGVTQSIDTEVKMEGLFKN